MLRCRRWAVGDDVEVGKENVFWIVVCGYVVGVLHVCNGE